jgi:maltooligosyltrehalose trehalohydrolase
LVLFDGEPRREIAMEAERRGFHVATEFGVGDGQRYSYRLDGGPLRSDPCSLWQPDGVDGPSAVVFTDSFAWTDHDWHGVNQCELVFYELHVGTFTPDGTFDAIIPRLTALRDLGITALEIMPVGQFPGTRNWGYDGVFAFAAQNSYGGPHGLQRLINAAHTAGLAVFLDVIYNHFGPEGNYLREFGPYFSERYHTPWGAAVNFDDAGCDAVRDFVVDNVRMWLEEFHVDGLRLDAADKIIDLGPLHILRAIEEAVVEAAASRGWPAIVTAESDLNDPRLLYSSARGGYGLDAQWADDYHHAVHAFFTGERQGYYADFGDVQQLAQVLDEPYLFQGEFSRFRDRKHGAPPAGLTGERFVVSLQNHDQVGNRAGGERLSALLDSKAKERLLASYLLLSPYLPLLFMGQEYGESRPFPFFCSFADRQLVDAVGDGLRRQYRESFPGIEVPDPGAEATFESARLSWSWPEGTCPAGLRRLYRDLLAARRHWPALLDFQHRRARWNSPSAEGHVLVLERGQAKAETLRAFFNLGDGPQPLGGADRAGMSVLFSSESAAYCGARGDLGEVGDLAPFECLVLGPAVWKSFP